MGLDVWGKISPFKLTFGIERGTRPPDSIKFVNITLLIAMDWQWLGTRFSKVLRPQSWKLILGFDFLDSILPILEPFFLLIWDINAIQLKQYWSALSSLSLNSIAEIGWSCCRSLLNLYSKSFVTILLGHSCLLPPLALWKWS